MSVWFYMFHPDASGSMVLFDGLKTYWLDDLNRSSCGYLKLAKKKNWMSPNTGAWFYYIGELDFYGEDKE